MLLKAASCFTVLNRVFTKVYFFAVVVSMLALTFSTGTSQLLACHNFNQFELDDDLKEPFSEFSTNQCYVSDRCFYSQLCRLFPESRGGLSKGCFLGLRLCAKQSARTGPPIDCAQ